ncbi:MAG: ferrochelatase [Bacteroidetes bacterium MedPE-SWsnd-G1]|nr:MAG: ferrochelatase [Bacteroidetes bacterium MedPE-SWsnd-G1]
MKGVLLVNLGSPDSTSTKDVRKYLDEFLMDERVIDMAYWKRFLLVKGIILNTRPKKSGAAYKKIWWDEGSPLIVLSERFTEKFKQKVNIPVALGMRYGSMSIQKGINELHEQGVTEIFMIPLYPHYAMSSYETVVVKAEEVIAKDFPSIKLETFPVFYNDKEYINTMVESIKRHLEGIDYEHILFSYHGIPERHIRISDTTKSHCQLDGSCCNKPSEAHKTCYRHQCFETTKEIVKQLDLEGKSYSNSFQSRLLKDPWLKPYTDFELEAFPDKGKKKIAVITPAFVTDCLETLEEIAMEGKEQFLEAGGEKYFHVPCLNDDDKWIDTVVNWTKNWEQSKN